MSHLHAHDSSKIRLINLTKVIGYSKQVTRLKKVWVSIMSHFTKLILQQPRRPQQLQQQNQLFMIQIALSTVLMEDAFGHMTFWDRQNANVTMTHQSTMQWKKHARRNRRKSALSHVQMDDVSCNIIWWVSHFEINLSTRWGYNWCLGLKTCTCNDVGAEYNSKTKVCEDGIR